MSWMWQHSRAGDCNHLRFRCAQCRKRLKCGAPADGGTAEKEYVAIGGPPFLQVMRKTGVCPNLNVELAAPVHDIQLRSTFEVPQYVLGPGPMRLRWLAGCACQFQYSVADVPAADPGEVEQALMPSSSSRVSAGCSRGSSPPTHGVLTGLHAV